MSALLGVPAWEVKCQAFGDVYREVPHHRCSLGTLDPSEPFEGLCGNGRFYVSGFRAPRTKGLCGLVGLSRVPGCASSVVLGVCVLGADLCVCDRTPGNEGSEHFVILGEEL